MTVGGARHPAVISWQPGRARRRPPFNGTDFTVSTPETAASDSLATRGAGSHATRSCIRVALVAAAALCGAALPGFLLLVGALPGVPRSPWVGAVVFVGAIVFAVLAGGLVRDLVRGVVLLADDQLRAGDYVEVAGRTGTVERVGLRTVRLRDEAGVVHFLRASDVGAVTNHSFGRSHAVLEIPVTGDGEIEHAVECIRAAAAEVRARPGNTLRILDEVEVCGIERWEREYAVVRARVAVAPGLHDIVRREMLAQIRRTFIVHGVGLAQPCDLSLSKLTVAGPHP
jgi:moderate conductance mechanosensitive channel